MFHNHVLYASNEGTRSGSSSSCPSTSSSFSSDGSSSSWESEMIMSTPTSTPRRGSLNFVKSEGGLSQNTTPTTSPTRYEIQTGFCTEPPSQEYVAPHSDAGGNLALMDYVLQMNMLSRQNMADYNGFQPHSSLNTGFGPGLHNQMMCDTFQTSQAINVDTPALALNLFSSDSGMDSSPISEDFVNPSQTTFISAFDLQSPMVPVKSLQFELSYDSPHSKFDPNFAVDDVSDATNMSYYVPSQHEEMSSSPAPTPTPSSLRPCYRPPPSAAALQRLQTIETEERGRTRYRDIKHDFVCRPRNNGNSNPPTAGKLKRMKRQPKDFIIGDIRMVRGPRKECTYEGCAQKFQRQEHLKRHEKTHQKNAEVYPCHFCPKTFGRPDNLKSHVWLHSLPDGLKKSRRTAYNARALEEWQRMDRKRSKGCAVTHDSTHAAGHAGIVKNEDGAKPGRARVDGY